MAGASQDQQIIAGAVQAIMGRSPDPDTALMAFVKAFGEQALSDLVQRVKAMQSQGGGGHVQGPGTGTSDSIPAVVNGTQPAALSDGEFVVPSDVVSGLGGGSNDAGAQQLYGMMNAVRGYAEGGSVSGSGLPAGGSMFGGLSGTLNGMNPWTGFSGDIFGFPIYAGTPVSPTPSTPAPSTSTYTPTTSSRPEIAEQYRNQDYYLQPGMMYPLGAQLNPALYGYSMYNFPIKDSYKASTDKTSGITQGINSVIDAMK